MLLQLHNYNSEFNYMFILCSPTLKFFIYTKKATFMSGNSNGNIMNVRWQHSDTK